MKYRLNNSLKVITSSIVLMIPTGNNEYVMREYNNGEELVNEDFDTYYLVDDIKAEDNHVVIKLIVNNRINNTNWVGEEQVSFF